MTNIVRKLKKWNVLLLCNKHSQLNHHKCTVYTPSYKRTVDDVEEKQPVHKFIGKHRKRVSRIHVCGLTVTGALGVLKLPLPENKLRIPPKFQQNYPYHLIIDDISHIACGYGFSILASKLKDQIKVWGCGINTNSQIGFHKSRKTKIKKGETHTKSYQYLMEPTPIPLPFKDAGKTRVIDVACGRAHSLILTDKEGIFAMGNNAFGQCGRQIIEGEVYESSAKVHRIPHERFPSPVVKVVCGMDHSLFLTQTGELFSCGWSADGQTGLGIAEPVPEPTQLRGDLDGVKITQVSSFADTSLALSDTNDIFGWGSSEYGQLACVTESTQAMLPTKLPFDRQKKIIQVAAGGTACLLLNESGDVWVWGYGILGKGPNLENAVWPRRIPRTLFGFSQFKPDIHVKQIKCGLGSFSAITNTGELYTWGKNKSGCLGIGSARDQYFPWKVLTGFEVVDVSCGVDHMVVKSKSLL
ncbi:unnamed protein product [Clavelina lepadiformis]|uniref:RCC1-like domain-containing protein n=1 Tax=Clavelina lepadiformis TaxID=159417 RepID=A0ABP0FCS0_CLALP